MSGRRQVGNLPHVRHAVSLVLVLFAVGCGGKPYEGRNVSELERMLASPDPKVQVQGAFGLSLHGADAQPAIPALVQALKSEHVLLRQHACLALGKIGAHDAPATAALVATLNDPEWTVRRQAAVAIGQIRPPLDTVAEALARCERDTNAQVRKAARDVLAAIRKLAGKR